MKWGWRCCKRVRVLVHRRLTSDPQVAKSYAENRKIPHSQRPERHPRLLRRSREYAVLSSHFSGKWGLNQTFFLIHKLLTVFKKYSDFFENPCRNLLGLPRLGR